MLLVYIENKLVGSDNTALLDASTQIQLGFKVMQERGQSEACGLNQSDELGLTLGLTFHTGRNVASEEAISGQEGQNGESGIRGTSWISLH